MAQIIAQMNKELSETHSNCYCILNEVEGVVKSVDC